MNSRKLVYLCSLISGLSLFILGILLLINIKTATPPPIQGNNTPEKSHSSNSLDLVENYITGGNPINFLVLIKEASGMHTDSILIVNYDPGTSQISTLTVPRDTKASNSGMLKVNNLFEKGTILHKEDKHKAAEYAAQIISTLTNISIDYYVYLEIDTIKEIIDKLDGVYFDVPADLKYSDPTQDLYIDLKKGYQLLDGDKAEQLLRFRKPRNLSKASADLRKFYDGSDLKRTEMQVRFVKEFINQKVNLLNLPKFIPIINYTFENVITNVSLSDTLNLLGGFAQSSRPEMNTFKLHGVDKIVDGEDYVVYINKFEDTKTRDVLNAQKIIDNHFISKSSLFTPDKAKKYNYKDILSINPSNAETDSVGDGQDKP